MDILSFINLGIGIGETIYNKLKDQSQENTNEQMHKFEKAVLKQTPKDFKDRFERSNIAIKAMWELMKEISGLTDNDLQNKISELDLQDGRRDGRIRKKPVTCKKCGSGVSYKHKKCMICGEEYPELSEIDTF